MGLKGRNSYDQNDGKMKTVVYRDVASCNVDINRRFKDVYGPIISLMMGIVSSSETSANFPEDIYIHARGRENSKFHQL
jgi:hypothetical protein